MSKMICALLSFYCTSVLATTVYRTVDEQGVVGFSDVAPVASETVQSVEVLELTTIQPQSPEAYSRALQDMREATDKLVADRRAREAHRAEMRKHRAESHSQPVPVTAYVQPQYRYLPVYRGHRRHHEFSPLRHNFPARAHRNHNVPRRTFLPPHITPNNSQLMRPLLSRRH